MKITYGNIIISIFKDNGRMTYTLAFQLRCLNPRTTAIWLSLNSYCNAKARADRRRGV